MSLTSDEREAIVTFRVQKAKDTFAEAEGIATLSYWNAVINRLYYACFYMTSALLIQNNYSAQTHSGVIRLFGLHFVKTGIISKEAGKLYSKLFELRQTGDYDDLFNLTEDDVKPMIPLAHNFMNELQTLISAQ
ncbi:MAG TPA: antitoxin [Prolixibacteraceae bacterium]|nr:antitoxin [Prolixibacteraceae bacterium]